MEFDLINETITPTNSTSLTVAGTGALFIPAGSTAERPGSPQSGYIRFNTDNTALEYYNGVAVAWQTFGNANINAIASVSGTGFLTQTSPGVYAARTITGTASKVTVTNGDGVSADPTIDISSSYVGQTSITTLGVVGVGTWNASIITANVGGTGQSSYAIGDILYASAATTLSKLSDIATGNALISGGVTAAPSWGKIGLTTHVTGTLPIANGGTNSATALSGSSIMVSNGTSIVQGTAGTTTTVLHGNAAGAPTYSAVSLTADVTGTLAVGNGGTGLATTPTNGQLLIGNGTNYTLATLTAGTNVSITNGAGSITINSTGGSGTPGGATTNVQYNNAGAFGGSSAFNFISGANPVVTITGTTATNQLRVGGSTAAGTSTVYIETNASNQDGQLVYFNSGSAATSGYISYAYDSATPYLRITDADDDPPYIAFNVIGAGTYAAPTFSNVFGGRGPVAGATTGFSWKVSGTEVATLDSQYFLQPSGTTAQRPTPAVGMSRYNTDLGAEEVYQSSAWVQNIGIIDKTVVSQTVSATGTTNILNYTVPGGTLGTNRLLRIRLGGTWQVSGGTARSVTLTVSYGGTTMWADTSPTLASGSTVPWEMDLILLSNNSVTAQQLTGRITIGATGATTGTGGLVAALNSFGIIAGTQAATSSSNQSLTISTAFSGTTISWVKFFHTIEVM